MPQIKEALIWDEGFGVVYERSPVGNNTFEVFCDGQKIDQCDEQMLRKLLANNKPEDKEVTYGK